VTQPLNYCTHAIEFFKHNELIMYGKTKIGNAIGAEARECAVLLHMAEKFILPDWGRIFTKEEMRTCDDLHLPTRLPYPVVAIEFPCDYKNPQCEPMMPQELPSSKRIALCVETEVLKETDMIGHIHKKHVGDAPGFYVFPISYSDHGSLWTPPPVGMFFPRGGNVEMNDMKQSGLIAVMPLGFVAYDEYPENQRKTRMGRDLSDEIFAMLHLMVALAVDHGKYETLPAPAKLNKKRAKKNRVPLYEYKVLDIVADVLGPKPASKPHQGGTHASPRMHKRRGHIRRLRSGRTTWIRNMIVGKPTAGTVEKEYSVHE
jgi:hypothetical protein